MAKSKTHLVMADEMSLDEWVDKTLAPTVDTIYFIFSSITRFMDSLEID